MTSVIESASNEKIKAASKLAVSAKERKEKSSFLLEGLRLCRDAAECGVSVRTFFYTQNAFEKHEADVRFISSKAENTFLISKAAAQKLSDTQTPQGFFCACPLSGRTTFARLSESAGQGASRRMQQRPQTAQSSLPKPI